MKQWTEYEAAQLEALKRLQEAALDTVACPNCKSTWFEEIKAYQFKSDHQVIHGQEVPKKMGPFIFLRCLACDELTEPRVLRLNKDSMDKSYDDLLDTLSAEKKDDLAEKV